MAEPWGSRRRGVSKNVTLKDEAAAYLAERCTGRKTQGNYLSVLLLAERAREEERARLKEGIEQVFAETTAEAGD